MASRSTRRPISSRRIVFGIAVAVIAASLGLLGLQARRDVSGASFLGAVSANSYSPQVIYKKYDFSSLATADLKSSNGILASQGWAIQSGQLSSASNAPLDTNRILFNTMAAKGTSGQPGSQGIYSTWTYHRSTSPQAPAQSAGVLLYARTPTGAAPDPNGSDWENGPASSSANPAMNGFLIKLSPADGSVSLAYHQPNKAGGSDVVLAKAPFAFTDGQTYQVAAQVSAYLASTAAMSKTGYLNIPVDAFALYLWNTGARPASPTLQFISDENSIRNQISPGTGAAADVNYLQYGAITGGYSEIVSNGPSQWGGQVTLYSPQATEGDTFKATEATFAKQMNSYIAPSFVATAPSEPSWVHNLMSETDILSPQYLHSSGQSSNIAVMGSDNVPWATGSSGSWNAADSTDGGVVRHTGGYADNPFTHFLLPVREAATVVETMDSDCEDGNAISPKCQFLSNPSREVDVTFKETTGNFAYVILDASTKGGEQFGYTLAVDETNSKLSLLAHTKSGSGFTTLGTASIQGHPGGALVPGLWYHATFGHVVTGSTQQLYAKVWPVGQKIKDDSDAVVTVPASVTSDLQAVNSANLASAAAINSGDTSLKAGMGAFGGVPQDFGTLVQLGHADPGYPPSIDTFSNAFDRYSPISNAARLSDFIASGWTSTTPNTAWSFGHFSVSSNPYIDSLGVTTLENTSQDSSPFARFISPADYKHYYQRQITANVIYRGGPNAVLQWTDVQAYDPKTNPYPGGYFLFLNNQNAAKPSLNLAVYQDKQVAGPLNYKVLGAVQLGHALQAGQAYTFSLESTVSNNAQGQPYKNHLVAQEQLDSNGSMGSAIDLTDATYTDGANAIGSLNDSVAYTGVTNN
jgi:hypothetical protein